MSRTARDSTLVKIVSFAGFGRHFQTAGGSMMRPTGDYKRTVSTNVIRYRMSLNLGGSFCLVRLSINFCISILRICNDSTYSVTDNIFGLVIDSF